MKNKINKILVLGFLCSVNVFAQDMDYKYDFGTRLEYDAGIFYLPDDNSNEENLRRARISHKGSFFDKTLFYELEVDGANYGDDEDDNDELKFKDNYLGYKNKIKSMNLNYRVKVGNIKVPFGLDSYAGSSNSAFMESSLTDTFTQSRKKGIEALFSKKHEDNRFNFHLGSFKNSIDENRDKDEEIQRNAMKFAYSYKLNKNSLIHIGTSYLRSDLNGENVKYSQEAESSFLDDKYVSTKVKNVNNTKDIGFEALYLNNSFHFQAEYLKTNVDSENGSYTFNGYYAQMGYFLFGGEKKFKTTTSKLSNKGIKDGDVELGFRYSYIDLNDKDEEGGTQKDYNFALNYYINKNVKLMTNYIIAYPKSENYDGKFSVLQTRIGIAF